MEDVAGSGTSSAPALSRDSTCLCQACWSPSGLLDPGPGLPVHPGLLAVSLWPALVPVRPAHPRRPACLPRPARPVGPACCPPQACSTPGPGLPVHLGPALVPGRACLSASVLPCPRRACLSASGLLVCVRCSCWPRVWGHVGPAAKAVMLCCCPRGRRTSRQLSHQGRKAYESGQHDVRQAPCGPEGSPPKVYRLTRFPGLLFPARQVKDSGPSTCPNSVPGAGGFLTVEGARASGATEMSAPSTPGGPVRAWSRWAPTHPLAKTRRTVTVTRLSLKSTVGRWGLIFSILYECEGRVMKVGCHSVWTHHILELPSCSLKPWYPGGQRPWGH